MAQQIEDRLTPVTAVQFANILGWVWDSLMGVPTKESVLVLTAQSALETGRWKATHNYNFGNVKSVEGDERDYAFFACDELLPQAIAKHYADASTPQAPCKITGTTANGLSIVWFYPNHSGCRFRAFCEKNPDGTIDETSSFILGMTDYLELLKNRFAQAWPAVLAGDPATFVQKLKAQGYFTADEKTYEKEVVSLFHEFSSLAFDPTNLAAKLIPDAPPVGPDPGPVGVGDVLSGRPSIIK